VASGFSRYALGLIHLAPLLMSSLVSSLFAPLLKIILPVFALIFAGYACRKTNRLGPNASSELNRFVVYLALPALLFDIMATTFMAHARSACVHNCVWSGCGRDLLC
jgi:hypothetical protein